MDHHSTVTTTTATPGGLAKTGCRSITAHDWSACIVEGFLVSDFRNSILTILSSQYTAAPPLCLYDLTGLSVPSQACLQSRIHTSHGCSISPIRSSLMLRLSGGSCLINRQPRASTRPSTDHPTHLGLSMICSLHTQLPNISALTFQDDHRSEDNPSFSASFTSEDGPTVS
jgi:hypothetical protein